MQMSLYPSFFRVFFFASFFPVFFFVCFFHVFFSHLFSHLLCVFHTDFNSLIYSPISVVSIFQFFFIKRFAVSKLEPMLAIGCIRLNSCGLTSCTTQNSLLGPAHDRRNLEKLNWTQNAFWNQSVTLTTFLLNFDHFWWFFKVEQK